MYLRDRIIVLTPVFLIAGPGLIGVYNLGGGVAVGILSGAVGFAAAAVLRHRLVVPKAADPSAACTGARPRSCTSRLSCRA